MRYVKFIAASILVNIAFISSSFAQENYSNAKFIEFPNRIFNKITDDADALSARLEKKTEKVIERMLKNESRLKKKIAEKDSVKAQQLFSESILRYEEFKSKLKLPEEMTGAHALKEYIPQLDSVQTALKFLQQKDFGLPVDQVSKIQLAGSQFNQLQGKLQIANEVQSYIKQREQILKEQLNSYHLESQLLKINKDVYYYQAQIIYYKNILKDPEKCQQTLLSAVEKSTYFKKFWQKNSYWSFLFPATANEGTDQALVGLQIRGQLQKELQQKFGITKVDVSNIGTGGGGAGFLQQQMQLAQNQLKNVKNLLSQWGGNSSMTMPDFQPNSQHPKSFLKRLYYDLGIQNTSSTYLLPAISTISLNVGYKINDKTTAGIGVNYLLGLGNGFNHIRLSNQGVGGKLFMDIKAKGSIWISGGMELNYMQQFSSLQSLYDLNIWQKSILLGLTKKYKIGKRENNIQLLYNFLALYEIPRSQPIVFRMGWGL